MQSQLFQGSLRVSRLSARYRQYNKMWVSTHLYCPILCKHYLCCSLHIRQHRYILTALLQPSRPAHVQLGLYRWRLWRSLLNCLPIFLCMLFAPGLSVRSRRQGSLSGSVTKIAVSVVSSVLARESTLLHPRP